MALASMACKLELQSGTGNLAPRHMGGKMKLTTHTTKFLSTQIAGIHKLLLPEPAKVEQVCALATGDGMSRYMDSVRGAVTASMLVQLQKEYQEYFTDLLSKYGAASPDKLSDQKKNCLLYTSPSPRD